MSELRVLTVRQPYAWAIIHGGKDIENRTRNIAGSYRGPVAIHAALQAPAFDTKHPELWPLDERHVTGETTLEKARELHSLQVQIDSIRDIIESHPSPCELHPDGDVVKCGWKSAYQDVVEVLR